MSWQKEAGVTYWARRSSIRLDTLEEEEEVEEKSEIGVCVCVCVCVCVLYSSYFDEREVSSGNHVAKPEGPEVAIEVGEGEDEGTHHTHHHCQEYRQQCLWPRHIPSSRSWNGAGTGID